MPAERLANILVIEDDTAMRELVVEALQDEGYRVEAAPGGRAGIERARAGGLDLVISDVRMPDLDGLDVLREIKAVTPSPHVIVMTAFGSIEQAIRAVRLGAYEYITKPFQIEALMLAVERALGERNLRARVAKLEQEAAFGRERFGALIGKSKVMQEVFALIARVGASSASVMITGESGTGKELVARALHQSSPRKDQAFLALNCAAIPEQLLESELFGYKRGAFTDARTDKSGLFLEADKGTLFLDEVAELAPALQAKLLRVLEEREVRPLGATRSEKIDVRVLAATNRDLEQGMQGGSFRSDLFYRLNVVQIALPPLRARPEDVRALAEHFLNTQAVPAGGRRVRGIAPAAMRVLEGYPWPGNVRELVNVIERAVALADSEEITEADLPAHLKERRPTDLLAGAVARNLTLSELEREYIERVLADEGGNKTRAASRLGLDRKTLYRKLDEYGKSASTPSHGVAALPEGGGGGGTGDR
ncbi:MAG: sigma-54-dependent Fis family transcriptional regulator [Deltaproteobacteria bacterium]|nr:sigma-54-dependent Fis family transcriptional regulator [Deltaproteobacteria bacterium]